MKKILLLKLQLIKTKQAKFVYRLEKALEDGSFHTMQRYQKNKLIQRVEKVKLQLTRLEALLKYGSLAAVTALTLTASQADAQTMTAQGAEFRVNTFTTGNQSSIDVSTGYNNPVSKHSDMDANGNFVVTWQSKNQAGATSGYDIYAQRYNAAGVAQGSEFLVNTFTTGKQINSSVAMDPDGDFVIAWQSDQLAYSLTDIYAQRYNAAGEAQSGEFMVNTRTISSQTAPAVAMDNSGNFIVAWNSNNQAAAKSYEDVYLKRYNAAGTVVAEEVLVNNYTTNNQQVTAAAMDPNGNYVVTWQSFGQNAAYSNLDIYAKRYNAAGVAQGTSFLVNTATTYNTQSYASVDMDANGDFVIAWQSNNQLAFDGTYNIYAKKYSNAGVSLTTNEFLVNTVTSKQARNASVAMADNGSFVVAWFSNNVAGANSLKDVHAQRYNASAAKQGAQFLVNTFTTGNQTVPSVAMNGAGNVVISWASNEQDGSGYGTYAQRYFIASTTTGVFSSGENAENIFTCYPNPSKGILTINVLKDLGETTVSISNTTGNVVVEERTVLTKDDTNSIDLSNFPAGVYIVQLTSAGGIQSKKIVIQ